MAYQFFTIDAGTSQSDVPEEMNHFLRSHKVVAVSKAFAACADGCRWCFCIEYMEGAAAREPEGRIDYRKILSGPHFARFSLLREVRKQIAQDHGEPVYAIFDNDDLRKLSEGENPPTMEDLLAIDGFGEKKARRYGERFVKMSAEAYAARLSAGGKGEEEKGRKGKAEGAKDGEGNEGVKGGEGATATAGAK